MFTIFLVSVLWLSLTYQYGYESFIILLILDLCLFFIQKKFVKDEKYVYRKQFVFTFIISFFGSFVSAFKVTFLLLFQKIHRGVYEMVVQDISRLDQFFLSTSITIIPNTIYLDRIGDAFLIHKIASCEKEAHNLDKIIFLKKTK